MSVSTILVAPTPLGWALAADAALCDCDPSLSVSRAVGFSGISYVVSGPLAAVTELWVSLVAPGRSPLDLRWLSGPARPSLSPSQERGCYV